MGEQAFLVLPYSHQLVVEVDLVLVGQFDPGILEILGGHAAKGYSIVTLLAAWTYDAKQLAAVDAVDDAAAAAAAADVVGTVAELAFVDAFVADEFAAEDVVGN